MKSKDSKKWRRYWRLEAIKRLGGKCVYCGFSDERALEFDHIKGGGKTKVKIRFGYGGYMDIALARIEGIQILCANCNKIKARENGEFGSNNESIIIIKQREAAIAKARLGALK